MSQTDKNTLHYIFFAYKAKKANLLEKGFNVLSEINYERLAIHFPLSKNPEFFKLVFKIIQYGQENQMEFSTDFARGIMVTIPNRYYCPVIEETELWIAEHYYCTGMEGTEVIYVLDPESKETDLPENFRIDYCIDGDVVSEILTNLRFLDEHSICNFFSEIVDGAIIPDDGFIELGTNNINYLFESQKFRDFLFNHDFIIRFRSEEIIFEVLRHENFDLLVPVILLKFRRSLLYKLVTDTDMERFEIFANEPLENLIKSHDDKDVDDFCHVGDDDEFIKIANRYCLDRVHDYIKRKRSK